MENIAKVNLAVVAVGRDCFPTELSMSRCKLVSAECKKIGLEVFALDKVVESEKDVLYAIDKLKAAGANALVVYLGNFGPEGPETMLAQKFDGPCMFVAAAEESQKDLIGGRGDAYCGMLNASYNLGLRGIKAYIPEYPVGTPDYVAKQIADFYNIAKIVIGVKNLKVFSFGPRPENFYACNAPIKPLFDLGVEIQENSELDLFESFNNHAGDKRIAEVAADMRKELGKGNPYDDLLTKLAQFEVTLTDWMENNLGASKYAVFANKCWPAFQTQFGCVPCYVNSRFASRGIPISCEVDIYGAITEYMLAAATMTPPTLLDINNSVPADMYNDNKAKFAGFTNEDLFMGFHCGNTPSSCMNNCGMKYQLIMHRLLEPDSDPNISRGTLEGNIKPGDVTLFRLQSTADCELRSYIAQGQVIDVDPKSFGSIGIFAVPEMGRFYRHVLIEKRFPHHAGIGFKHVGKYLFEALSLLGVENKYFNQPKGMLYKNENPFA